MSFRIQGDRWLIWKTVISILILVFMGVLPTLRIKKHWIYPSIIVCLILLSLIVFLEIK